MCLPLEARHLNSFKKSFKETCKYVFSFIVHDRIICSWWLDILNVRFNEFRCIRCFHQNLGKFIYLRSQHNLKGISPNDGDEGDCSYVAWTVGKSGTSQVTSWDRGVHGMGGVAMTASTKAVEYLAVHCWDMVGCEVGTSRAHDDCEQGTGTP